MPRYDEKLRGPLRRRKYEVELLEAALKDVEDLKLMIP